MKFLVVAVLAFAAIVQARDLSKYTPKRLTAWPRALPVDTDPRIVNGDEADPHQFPYQVAMLGDLTRNFVYQCALFIDGGSFCGCSILDSNTILTAAHCADGARSIEVVAGGHKIQESEASQQSITSTNFVVHEDWDPNNISNDIALIILPESLTLDGETVAAVDLYSGDSSLEDENATVSGWGRPSDSSSTISPVLRYTSDVIISNSACSRWYGIIKSTNICLSGQNRRSSCNGDSGGPLVIVEDGTVKEIGIVSFGSAFGCGIGFPSAYSRVSSFTSWIAEKRASL